jgi:hypothetical protein
VIPEKLRVQLVAARQRSDVRQLDAVMRDDGQVEIVIALGGAFNYKIFGPIWPGTAEGWLQHIVHDTYLRRCLEDAKKCKPR